MRFYLGVTNINWYTYLSSINPEDINFWKPGGTPFKAIPVGAPFGFKLKSPLNAIGGVGFFFKYTTLPISVAWDTFKERNGHSTFKEFQNIILSHRSDKASINPEIGCIVLTNPIFFHKEDWIETPANWGNSIVSGKGYSDSENDPIGKAIWSQIHQRILKYLSPDIEVNQSFAVSEPQSPEYNSILTKVRIGQGAFRVSVTDAYQRRCSISGEKTLPVLEAAHIQPYSESGPNQASNGLLLRSDIHKLFDTGYLTITKELKVEVSNRIKQEFENGKDYYKYHGKDMALLPVRKDELPDTRFIEWHNQHLYNG
jgi:putative restriction endonuclease